VATGSARRDGRKRSDDAGKKEKDDNDRRGPGGFATIQSGPKHARMGMGEGEEVDGDSGGGGSGNDGVGMNTPAPQYRGGS